ncbi:hypothetical protein [Paenibacillus agilis]|uniref:Uncharacterized protein n=1 Tax=Paenibacillus agilis TaxID=3020863 RepID=A0A559IQ10_9BACL|nr:hypothetical protein [Paenibacillus agilis]TVX89623.1 hypothetical protein FPZ44_17790 [Paenibacillus agilis]
MNPLKNMLTKVTLALSIVSTFSLGSLASNTSALPSNTSLQLQPTEAKTESAVVTTQETTNKPLSTKSSKHKNVIANMKKLASKAKYAHELITYMDKHIHKVKPEQATEMLIILEKYYENHVEQVIGQLNELIANPKLHAQLKKLGSNLNKFDKIKDKSFKKWLLLQQKGKLKLNYDGTLYFYYVDYEAIQKAYGSAFNKDTAFYLQYTTLSNKELYYIYDDNKKPPYETLMKRAAVIDEYIQATPKSRHLKEIKDLHHGYLWQFFNRNWDDMIDKKTGKLHPKMKKTYASLIEKYGESRSGSLLVKYVDLIAQHKDAISDSDGNILPYMNKFWEEEYSKLYKETFK